MPIGTEWKGILRIFSPMAQGLYSQLKLTPGYGTKIDQPILVGDGTIFFEDSQLYLHTSAEISIEDDSTVVLQVAASQECWALLTAKAIRPIDADIAWMLKSTGEYWSEIGSHFSYEGLFQRQAVRSIRAIQQLSCAQTGGMLAAATTSLPEVIGGERNYDYRYVWVRDTALITGALSVLDGDVHAEYRFLDFLSKAIEKNPRKCIYPLYTIDHEKIDHLEELNLSGYYGSRPVQIGNVAAEQLQLDAAASVLIACQMIYEKYKETPHWPLIRKITDFVSKNWRRPDNGIWEEGKELHYTAGKVFCARALEMMARYSEDPIEADEWLEQAALIRKFVKEHCMTSDGAFANFAGSQEVDISAALFTVWGYCEANSNEMRATTDYLEKNYQKDNLYWRSLVEFDSHKEGAFLAGTCWLAHHYAIAGDFSKSEQILRAVEACANDLGYFSEEFDPIENRMLGNFNQTFVHSSFICAANGLSCEMNGISTIVR
ncbi:glycoside hydrolase family 15 protein [Sphingobacterium bambusae]|uniref:Glycoside hydrolase family 15 protein n=1 Tax=Sphingobacterium bambusae TaxID=662858 RepID=A0ABW6BCT4_9SPHI|nr:glycoside hydrolase family 15 protein [Sphingobacterium bambusae]WPL48496.1 glycoside hydrolase family 15 protein [Sphingobacterium bambusae]